MVVLVNVWPREPTKVETSTPFSSTLPLTLKLAITAFPDCVKLNWLTLQFGKVKHGGNAPFAISCEFEHDIWSKIKRQKWINADRHSHRRAQVGDVTIVRICRIYYCGKKSRRTRLDVEISTDSTEREEIGGVRVDPY